MIRGIRSSTANANAQRRVLGLAVWIRPRVLSLLLCLFAGTVCCTGEAAGASNGPISKHSYRRVLEGELYFAGQLLPAADGNLVAFTLSYMGADERRPWFPWPVWVIDGSGEVVARTTPKEGSRLHQWALGWLPGNRELLLMELSLSEPDGHAGLTESTGDRLLALHVPSGKTREVFGRDGVRVRSAHVLTDGSAICRLTGTRQGDGLFILGTGNDEGLPEALVLDADDRQWQRCYWAQRAGAHMHAIVSSGDSPNLWPEALWSVEVGPEDETRMDLLAEWEPFARWMAVSPDGDQIAAVLHAPEQNDPVNLLRLDANGPETSTLSPPVEVGFAAFSPSGQKLLLWDNGAHPDLLRRHPELVHRAALVLVDTEDGRMRRLPLPEAAAPVFAAAWLDETTVLASASYRGIFQVDLDSQEWHLLWELPDWESVADAGVQRDGDVP